MLLLLFRNMLWAAWWPYSTMLLAVEKAAQQSARAANPSPGGAPLHKAKRKHADRRAPWRMTPS